MPHNEGITATVTRLDQVIFARNLFGGFDARVFMDGEEEPRETIHAMIAVTDPDTRAMLGLDGCGSAYPMEDDVLLWCERSGKYINWYKVTYELAGKQKA